MRERERMRTRPKEGHRQPVLAFCTAGWGPTPIPVLIPCPAEAEDRNAPLVGLGSYTTLVRTSGALACAVGAGPIIDLQMTSNASFSTAWSERSSSVLVSCATVVVLVRKGV
jgi:hypothetical protein